MKPIEEETVGNPKSKIGYTYSPLMLLHKKEGEHPERPERVESIDYHLTVTKLKK